MEQPRHSTITKGKFLLGSVECDFDQRTLDLEGKTSDLSELSFRLLEALVDADGRLVSNKDLRGYIWDGNIVGEDALKQRVKLLRDQFAALGAEAKMISTVRGKGYRLACSIEPVSENSGSGTKLFHGARKTAVYVLGVLLLSILITALYESAYTPYRLRQTTIVVLPIEAIEDSNFTGTNNLDDLIMRALVEYSGLTVVLSHDLEPADYSVKINLETTTAGIIGQATVIERENGHVAGIFEFTLPEAMTPAGWQGKAQQISTEVATIIRGFPKPQQ